MSDIPEGDDWWQATDGRWYPPELFTGPDDLRPASAAPTDEAPPPDDTARADDAGQTGDPAQTDDGPAPGDAPPSGDEQEPGDGPASSWLASPAMRIMLGVLAVVVVVGLALILLGNRGGDQDDEATRTDPFASTSKGPVAAAGDIQIAAEVPPTQLIPQSCDEWARLLRVEIQDQTGTAVTDFGPVARGGGEIDRNEKRSKLSCSFDYEADVPAAPDYTVALTTLQDGGRPIANKSVEGAKEGKVDFPTFELDYTCVGPPSAPVCDYRPRT